MTPRRFMLTVAATLVGAGAVVGCGPSPTSVPPTAPVPVSVPMSVSKSAAPDDNPTGNTPVEQAYVPFTPPARVFSVSVPGGWAQSTDGPATVFADGLNAVRIEEQPELVAVTPATVQRWELPALRAATAGYRFEALSVVQRRSGPAILITYQATSPPNGAIATGGVDSVERYTFWRQGFEVITTLSGPLGADNADRWRTITDSLQWL